MRRAIVTYRNAELVQCRSRGNVGSVESGRGAARDRHAYATRVALHDERIAVEPEALGEASQQRIHRRKDTPVRDVGARIRAQRAPVDDDRDGSAWWE